MSNLREWLLRVSESLRPRRHARDHQAELQAHLDLATEEARGRGLSAEAAARAARLRAGGLSQAMEAVHDQRAFPWVDALLGDIRYGSRQILRYRTGSAAAILSLGLAIGATMAAFQLVDAVLLRPLPVADPARLFMAALGGSNANGDERYRDDFDYPEFREYSEAGRDVADVLLVGMSGRTQIIFEGATEPERLYRQFVSGNVFPILGLLPGVSSAWPTM